MRAVAAAAVAALAGCVHYLNPQCDDQIRNGGESDVDCGGGCGPCETGRACAEDRDCEGTCVADRCAAPVCENGVRDDGEADVDCGAGSCHPCAGGRQCQTSLDCYSALCVEATHRCFALATVAFAGATAYASGSKPHVLRAADLDGDGDLDLVAANELSSTIAVFLNDRHAAGTFTRILGPIGSGFPTGASPTGLAIADVNHDGIPDVVTADRHGGSVSILLGRRGAAYTLAPKASFPTGAGGGTSSVAVGDLNNDGLADVIATNPVTASASVLLGRGDGTLLAAREVSIGIPYVSEPFAVALGDFDLDGTLDAAIADNRTARIVVLRGDGDGTFTPVLAQPRIGGGASYALLAHDMDRDGLLDLVTANRTSDSVSVLLGRGDGTFREARVSTTGDGTGPFALAVADFNLDGAPDVVTASYKTGTGSVLLGAGDGRFEPPLDTGAAGRASYGVATADFDGDGKPDVALANAVSNDVAIQLSTAH